MLTEVSVRLQLARIRSVLPTTSLLTMSSGGNRQGMPGRRDEKERGTSA